MNNPRWKKLHGTTRNGKNNNKNNTINYSPKRNMNPGVRFWGRIFARFGRFIPTVLTIVATLVVVTILASFQVVFHGNNNNNNNNKLRQQHADDDTKKIDSSSNSLPSGTTKTKEKIKAVSMIVVTTTAGSKTTFDVPVKCQYNGNCPVHTVCEDGFCLPYMGKKIAIDRNSNNDNGQRIQNCIDTCIAEVKVDEWYYYEMEPTYIRYAYEALNGHGCVIQYQRTQPIEVRPPNIEDWMGGRFRRVVRVDPAPESSLLSSSSSEQRQVSKQEWIALCDVPCMSDADCPSDDNMACIGRIEREVPTPKIDSTPGSCRKQSFMSDQQLPLAPDTFIVTAADSTYYKAMKNLAASVKFWSPENKLVVYNLGMTAEQLDDIKTWSNLHSLRWMGGIPKTLPSHFNELKNYAWKSIIMNETVHEYKSIIWADAGSTFVGPVNTIEDIIRWNGIFLVKGQDEDMKPMAHEGMFRYLGYDKATFRKGFKSPHYGGSVQAYVYPSRYIDTIVIPNAQCARDPQCIIPDGSNLGNHRYDQTAMSILAYKDTVQAPHYTEYLAADRAQVNADLSQPSHRILMLTSRGTCSYYTDLNIL
jgi:hypothetical protein